MRTRKQEKMNGTMSNRNDLSKPVVMIFLNSTAQSTKILTDYLEKNIDTLNKFFLINFMYITAKNAATVKGYGVRSTPTLLYKGRRFEGIKEILKMLAPPQTSENYGYGAMSPEEMLNNWQQDIIDKHKNEEDEEDDDPANPETRTQEIRQRMAAFQKKRPRMEGVNDKTRIDGGRPIKKSAGKGGSYSDKDGDTAFMRDSGVDNIEQTPGNVYSENADGELILEEYYLQEANKDGKSYGNMKFNSSKYGRR